MVKAFKTYREKMLKEARGKAEEYDSRSPININFKDFVKDERKTYAIYDPAIDDFAMLISSWTDKEGNSHQHKVTLYGM